MYANARGNGQGGHSTAGSQDSLVAHSTHSTRSYPPWAVPKILPAAPGSNTTSLDLGFEFPGHTDTSSESQPSNISNTLAENGTVRDESDKKAAPFLNINQETGLKLIAFDGTITKDTKMINGCLRSVIREKFKASVALLDAAMYLNGFDEDAMVLVRMHDKLSELVMLLQEQLIAIKRIDTGMSKTLRKMALRDRESGELAPEEVALVVGQFENLYAEMMTKYMDKKKTLYGDTFEESEPERKSCSTQTVSKDGGYTPSEGSDGTGSSGDPMEGIEQTN